MARKRAMHFATPRNQHALTRAAWLREESRNTHRLMESIIKLSGHAARDTR